MFCIECGYDSESKGLYVVYDNYYCAYCKHFAKKLTPFTPKQNRLFNIIFISTYIILLLLSICFISAHCHV